MKKFYSLTSGVLVLIAIFVVFMGLQTAGSAPQESVVVSIGCFIAILARLAQSAGQHYK